MSAINFPIYDTSLTVKRDEPVEQIVDKVGIVAAPIVGALASGATTLVLGEVALLVPAAAPVIFTVSPLLIAGAGITAAVATPILLKKLFS
ncbi:MAG: hypothetical protein KDK48_01755 [Chlamydiia bacterium]|nr:hypothetical protein [Chlamydiia bacterium]